MLVQRKREATRERMNERQVKREAVRGDQKRKRSIDGQRV